MHMNHGGYEEAFTYCENDDQVKKQFFNKLEEIGQRDIITKIAIYINEVLNICLLIPIVVILLKPNNDILQGLSKLDYLVKISVFQLYKDSM